MPALETTIALVNAGLAEVGLAEAGLSAWAVCLLFLAACAAGFVDSIAGGGGLITIPALLLSGLPPLTALGTNKLQGMFGSGSATLSYARRGHVSLRAQAPMALLSFAGAVGGALAVALMPLEALRVVIPVLLVLVAAFFAFKPNAGAVQTAARLSPGLFSVLVVPWIGFYDGLLGPGTGSFFMLAFVGLAGFEILKATAHSKLLNFASNLGGFAVFALGGAMVWWLGLLMGGGQALGAALGARLAMRQGGRVIRPLLVVTCLAMAARLLWD